MFAVAFAASLLQLLLAERAIRRGGGWIVTFILAGVVVNFLLPYGPNALLFLTLLLIVGFRNFLQPAGRRAAVLCAAYLPALGFAVEQVWTEAERYARLKEQHPFVSLEERIPKRASPVPVPVVSTSIER